MYKLFRHLHRWLPYINIKYYRQEAKTKLPRQVGELLIDRNRRWGFFDSACQEPDQICVIGGALYISDSLFFKFKTSLGSGTNNSAKLVDLRTLPKLTIDKNVTSLRVFGDSLLVTKWMNSEQNKCSLTPTLSFSSERYYRSFLRDIFPAYFQ